MPFAVVSLDSLGRSLTFIGILFAFLYMKHASFACDLEFGCMSHLRSPWTVHSLTLCEASPHLKQYLSLSFSVTFATILVPAAFFLSFFFCILLLFPWPCPGA